MAFLEVNGTRLYYEDTGPGSTGQTFAFSHGLLWSTELFAPQIAALRDRYRCIAWDHRGQGKSAADHRHCIDMELVWQDAVCLLETLGTGPVHFVGLSMGGFTALHLALGHSERVLSAVVAGAGYGAEPERAEAFRAESVLTAAAFAAEGAAKVAERYAVGPARVQFQNKNPRGWAEFAEALAGHSSLGSALTMRGVQAERPSLYALTDVLATISVPVLVLAGDEDEGCLEPALMLKRTIPTAGLVVLPRTGHTANLEEPDVFNRAVDSFLSSVARGSWHPRDPRSRSASTTGMS